MKSVVVIGGGVAGVVSALLAVHKGYRVTVVERSGQCGGLLSSFRDSAGNEFDYGTHLLRDTGIKELDDLLFKDLDETNWQRLPYLKAGSYFNKQFYPHSPYLNASFLPKVIYTDGLMEILHSFPSADHHNNAHDYLSDYFGRIFTEHIFSPILTKFFGTNLHQLAPNAHKLFGLDRIIAFSPEISREVKLSAMFDSKFSFHNSHEGRSGLNNYYPVRGGIGQWINNLVDKLSSLNATILTNCHIQSIHVEGNRIKYIALSNGFQVGADTIIWTINPLILLNLGHFCFRLARMRFRQASLYYYIFDKPFNTDVYFCVCFDSAFKTFRTTFYSNLRSDPAEKEVYSCCVEVLNDRESEAPSLEDIFDELKRMNMINASTKAVFSERKVSKPGFPVLTTNIAKESAELARYLYEQLENIILLGKASGRVFFTDDVLVDAYEAIHDRL